MRPCHSVTEEPKGGHFIFTSCRKLNIEPIERERATNTKSLGIFTHSQVVANVFWKTQIKLLWVQPIQDSACMERNRHFFFFTVKERHTILTVISILKSQMTRLVIYLFWRVKLFASEPGDRSEHSDVLKAWLKCVINEILNWKSGGFDSETVFLTFSVGSVLKETIWLKVSWHLAWCFVSNVSSKCMDV